MPFIRVRGATPGDPRHEFDVSTTEVERHPELYTVVDPEPVLKARAMTPVEGVVRSTPKNDERRPTPKRTTGAKRASSSAAQSKPGENTTAPAGADS